MTNLAHGGYIKNLSEVLERWQVDTKILVRGIGETALSRQ